MPILPTSSPGLSYGPLGSPASPNVPGRRDAPAAPLPPSPLREDGARVGSPAGDGAEGTASVDGGAPRGVDPSLWAILTREERAHFSRAHEMGPLTYGRKATPEGEPAPLRGVRLDVRV